MNSRWLGIGFLPNILINVLVMFSKKYMSTRGETGRVQNIFSVRIKGWFTRILTNVYE